MELRARHPFATDYTAQEDAWECADALGVTAGERLAEYANAAAVPGIEMRFPTREALGLSLLGWLCAGLAALGCVALIYGVRG